MNDRRAFQALMTGISEVHRVPFSEAMLSIWWECLRHFDDELVKRAVYAHITDPERGKFFPKPGEIIGLCTEIAREERARQLSRPALPGPKIPPAPWVRRMIDGFLALNRKHHGKIPGEEFKQLMSTAAADRCAANSTTKGEEDGVSRAGSEQVG